MRSDCTYVPLNKNQYRIDKTGILEKGIKRFPSLYIEGPASTGKSTAVRMLLEKHPKMDYDVIWMDEEKKNEEARIKVLERVAEYMQKHHSWLVIENLFQEEGYGEPEVLEYLKKMIHHLSADCRVILISRKQLPKEWMDLIWKEEMEVYTQDCWRFDIKDVWKLVDHYKVNLNPEELWQVTNGWAGCIQVLMRLSRLKSITNMTELVKMPEVRDYFRYEIFRTLDPKEQECIRIGIESPWINKEYCSAVWNFQVDETVLDGLVRKGILQYDEGKIKYRILPVFKMAGMEAEDAVFYTDNLELKKILKRAGDFYESSGSTCDALECFKKTGCVDIYKQCVRKHYKSLIREGVEFSEVIQWKEKEPEFIYLRAMFAYFDQDLKKMDREIHLLEEMKTDDLKKKEEILLNLYFIKPDYSVTDWMVRLNQCKSGKMELFNRMGGSISCLSGMKDLSPLFACSKKEENLYASIWKKQLGVKEWIFYNLAKMEYYMETEHTIRVSSDLLDLFGQDELEAVMMKFSFMCRRHHKEDQDEIEEQLSQIRYMVSINGCERYIKNAEAVKKLYVVMTKQEDGTFGKMAYRMRLRDTKIDENNYLQRMIWVKAALLLSQYDRADPILDPLADYLRIYQRSRLLAEVLFQRAIVKYALGAKADMLKSMIESFMIAERFRYVQFYTEYGSMGYAVLQEYIEWLKQNTPEGWHRKKKYNYGNVLRMPKEDYMEAILRRAKQNVKSVMVSKTEQSEHLTEMEQMILQEINKGLSNREICEMLNLKLPTVKSHIYNLYKKLDVTSRTQAVCRAREKGILRE